ncbi:MAG: hypothetical protein HAW59_03495 [Betaproteobacteria bacterium]|nr:hypothetical protein [Betaproteobacteria bacterium]
MEKKQPYSGVYVLINDAMPGMVKIGSAVDIEVRVKQHNSSTIPFSFNCYYACKLDDYTGAETKIREAFKKFRVSGREFFSILYENKEPLEIEFGEAKMGKSAEILAECVKAALSLFPGEDITEEINDVLPEESNEPLINLIKEVREMDAPGRKAHAKKIMAFLEGKPAPNPNVQTRQGVTPLILAATWNLQEVIEKLLSLNADPNAATAQGITPLMKAARHAGGEIIDLFLRRKDIQINALNKKGDSALDYAAGPMRRKKAQKIKKAGGKSGKELAPPEPVGEE